MPAIFSDPRNSLMVKDTVAAVLREEIIIGRLSPGAPIVEGKWATGLKVAQASIREAINILTAEGFVEKGAGRSARVTELSEKDVAQIYQVRVALEGLAASIVAQKQPDLSDLDQVIADMGSAVACANVRAFYERDLQFHILISQKAGNRYLEQEMRRLVVPLFAFVIMRVHDASTDAANWKKSIEQHQQILDAIRSGDPYFAEQQVRKTIQRFAAVTQSVLNE